MTNLYILRPEEGLVAEDNPWSPWYDKCFGFVVRATSEEAARKLAQEKAGDEKRGEFLKQKISNTKTPWLDPKYSTCEVLEAEGEIGIVMEDFHGA